MKNTKLLRMLLIAIAVVVSFSLFACTESPEAETESSVEESTPNTNETDPKVPADTAEETSDVNSEETSETTSEVTSEETSEETTEETTEAACEHVEEVVAGTAATCEETGLTDGKKCSACGETLVAQEVIPALGHAWDEGVVSVEPTCEDKGTKTYTCANDAAHTKTEDIDAIGHAWNEGEVTAEPDCENKGTKTYTCANDAAHTKTEEIDTLGHTTEWKYVSNVGTEYEGTRYAVQAKICSVCEKSLETRAAVVAFHFDSVAAADSTGAATGITGIGSGAGAMVTDPNARVTTQEAIYLRSGQFLMGSGWIGVAGEIDIEKAYYRILNNETGEVIVDWQEKVISDSSSSSVRPQVKPDSAGSYTSVKNQLTAHGVTDFTAYGFRTNNLVTKIGGTEYASKTTPIAIEYAVKIAGAPEGSDLIRVIIFKNVYIAG